MNWRHDHRVYPYGRNGFLRIGAQIARAERRGKFEIIAEQDKFAELFREIDTLRTRAMARELGWPLVALNGRLYPRSPSISAMLSAQEGK